VFANPALKVFARVGETRDAFVERCGRAAQESADAEIAKLHDRYQQKIARLETQQRTAEDRVRELQVDTRERVQQEIVSGAGQLLSVFLGGRRGGFGALSGAASRRSTTRRTQERLETARGNVDETTQAMAQVKEELDDEVAQIREKWQAVAAGVEAKKIPLDQTDVRVDEVVLVWLPA
jgi:chaperonin cofactor prefoldin